MITDPDIRDQAYQYFLEEAPDLLQIIEEEIFAINEGEVELKDRPLRVNELMRAAHTLKGGAANVGLETIKTVAHSMEDVFKALYNPELELDVETKRLIYESYECLREPLTAEFSKVSIDRDAILDRAATVFAQLQEIFGDYLTDQDAFPTSEELGLDVVESFFNAVIPERLQELHTAVAGAENEQIEEILRSQSEIFIGLAESLGLPGFGEIAQTILAALDRNNHNVLEVAKAAISNIEQAQKQVLEGDRERGGEPSTNLLQLASGLPESEVMEDFVSQINLTDQEDQITEFTTIEDQTTGFATLVDNPPEQDVAELTASLENEFSSDETETEAMEFLMEIEQETQALNQEKSSLSATAKSENDEDDDIFSLSPEDLQLLENDAPAPVENDDTFSLSSEDLQLLANNAPAPVENDESETIGSSFSLIEQDLDNSMASVILPQPPESSTKDNSSPELLGEIWGDEVEASQILNKSNNANKSDSVTRDINATSSQDSNVEQTEILKATSTAPLVKKEPERVSSTAKSKINSTEKSQKKHKKSINQTVRVNLESLEKLNDLVGEILINQNQNILKDEKIYNLVQELLNKINYNEQLVNNLINIVDEVYISPEQQKIRDSFPDRLQELITTGNITPLVSNSEILPEKSGLNTNGEADIEQLLGLVLNSNSELSQIAEQIKNYNKQAQRNTKKQQRMLLNMRDELIDTRMSPIGRVFNRFPRMLQQLSSTYNKKVDFKIFGGHILVDKTVEEKLYDPLLHLIRNGFDHGLETPEVRVQNGKSETGSLELRAYYQGGKTIIEIKDDGKGIDYEKIKNSAISKNIINEQEASRLSESRLLALIFEPGFSTAEKVSSLSGRGVGLDVVRSQIEAMDGSISIESIPNKGTTFSLQIPLTLTIAKLMLTQADGLTYALLTDAIEKIVIPTANQIRVFEGNKILHWETNSETQTIPVRKLADLIEYPRTILGRTRNLNEPDGVTNNPILLLRRQEGLVGLEVEKVLGEQELVIRPLGSAIAPPKYVYGCSFLKDSNLTLVIDGNVLLKHSKNGPSAITQNAYLADSRPKQLPGNTEGQLLLDSSNLAQTLLVVDDSSSLRKSIAMSLEKVSNQVIQAENGLHALEKLQQSGEVNLVVCDLEMPMMNGFQFLTALRQNKNLRDTPVIILTSRDSDKHRKLALQLGAAAYLIKPCDEQELFDTIDKIISKK